MSIPKTLYYNPAFITLEGNAVLSLVTREDERVIYNVIGFDGEYVIRVIDYRIQSLSGIDVVIETEDDAKFAEQFCYPAQVRITDEKPDILIELFDLDDNIQPDFMLWIVTGLEEPIPYYDYPFFRLVPLNTDSYSFVALFNYHHFRGYFDGLVAAPDLPVPAET